MGIQTYSNDFKVEVCNFSDNILIQIQPKNLVYLLEQ